MTARTNQQGQQIYRITLRGQIDEEFVTAFFPPETVLACDGDATCLSNIQADQASIIGLVRQLHNLGCTILALEC